MGGCDRGSIKFKLLITGRAEYTNVYLVDFWLMHLSGGREELLANLLSTIIA